ncbi:MAG: C40 family peptidase [Armatimonadetes bacterium]|nr:C40 family peptidase [Armatimonadota bacterium]
MAKNIIFYFAFSALLIIGNGYADGQLTITLDPPAEEQKDNLRLNHETLGATRENSAKYEARVLSARQTTNKEVVIGRVGVVRAASANIMRAPTKKGYQLFTCPKGSYLAIVADSPNWYGVLMIDGSTGWIEKSKVSLLNYNVVGQKNLPNGLGPKIVNTALKYLGIPYQWGGYSWNGLDCSGFVKAVFASHGIELPRTAREQANVGVPVNASNLQPGDRLYFACKGGAIDHCGIYIGNGLFIHSSSSRGGVAIDNLLTKPLYYNTLVAARRS